MLICFCSVMYTICRIKLPTSTTFTNVEIITTPSRKFNDCGKEPYSSLYPIISTANGVLLEYVYYCELIMRAFWKRPFMVKKGTL